MSLRPVEKAEQQPLSPEELKRRAGELFALARDSYASALNLTSLPELFRSKSLNAYQVKGLAKRAEQAAQSWREVANHLDLLVAEIERTHAAERSKKRMLIENSGDGVHYRTRWVKNDENGDQS